MVSVSPPPEEANPALLRLYQAIGYYVARWSLTEELLYIIYHRAARLPEHEFANEFFSIESYPMRVRLIIGAIRSKLWREREKCTEWESRVKSLNEFFGFRNIIAHNPVHEPQLNIDFTVPSGQGRVFVTHDYIVHPTFYSLRSNKGGMTYADIALKAKKLDAVIARLWVDIPRDFPDMTEAAQ